MQLVTNSNMQTIFNTQSIQTTPSTSTPTVHGLSGIVPTTNTCYMNSAIQALSHNYLLTTYLFNNTKEVHQILKKNARKIFKDNNAFSLSNDITIIPLELRQKIQDPNYHPDMLTDEESNLVFNHTITSQLTRLLQMMWKKNCNVVPISFRTVFYEARDKFFSDSAQHDAEEAFSCIAQKLQEELSEEKNVRPKTNMDIVNQFFEFRNEIDKQISKTIDDDKKTYLKNIYEQKKRELVTEHLIIEGFCELIKYYKTSYSSITEIFSGFLHSSTNCPELDCGHSSNKFDPFLNLSLPLPIKTGTQLSINDCMAEYCKEEILDDQNLWTCEKCKKGVKGIKKLQVWMAPPALVIQFKRFCSARNSKDCRLVNYPLEHFDINPIMSQSLLEPNKCTKYKLHCIINHKGNMNGGHYYTYCLHEDSGQWYEFDDDKIYVIKSGSMVTAAAYLLFYIREDMLMKGG